MESLEWIYSCSECEFNTFEQSHLEIHVESVHSNIHPSISDAGTGGLLTDQSQFFTFDETYLSDPNDSQQNIDTTVKNYDVALNQNNTSMQLIRSTPTPKNIPLIESVELIYTCEECGFRN